MYPATERDLAARVRAFYVEGVGIGNPQGSWFIAALTSKTVVSAGRSTPLTVTGTFDSRTSPRTGPS